ncbi:MULTISPECIES: NYN domain-containing protein [unclassified Mesorhizobium]|uniref:NYN domain-containing protein n=1 Tax=unclassified Mesorhizobium TaxID=325217 RepID=UPI0015E3D130|nr:MULTISPECIES: NYN domain-containing protein [unclassified Mesorhizobium]MBZ9927762.1 NYN domain-containing protein [Mesorhizobium sp. BR1-1-4]
MGENQGGKVANRAAAYIDGFNLYHPIREMSEPFLKWCNLWRLSELLCAPHDLALQKVVLCTAMQMHRADTIGRHRTFNNAQIASGVQVIEGHYIFNEELGRHSEKQSDINVALSLIMDGIDDIYDWAFLVSADSDQAATARVFKERFKEKRLVVVAPPNRSPPDKANAYADLTFTISKDQIERSLLPQLVPSLGGGFIRRPKEYDPPDWWMPPDKRPKRNR